MVKDLTHKGYSFRDKLGEKIVSKMINGYISGIKKGNSAALYKYERLVSEKLPKNIANRYVRNNLNSGKPDYDNVIRIAKDNALKISGKWVQKSTTKKLDYLESAVKRDIRNSRYSDAKRHLSKVESFLEKMSGENAQHGGKISFTYDWGRTHPQRKSKNLEHYHVTNPIGRVVTGKPRKFSVEGSPLTKQKQGSYLKDIQALKERLKAKSKTRK